MLHHLTAERNYQRYQLNCFLLRTHKVSRVEHHVSNVNTNGRKHKVSTYSFHTTRFSKMLHQTSFHCLQDLGSNISTPQNLLCGYCRYRGTHSEDRFTMRFCKMLVIVQADFTVLLLLRLQSKQ